jgi:CBS domain containing-hemolysin-like protein
MRHGGINDCKSEIVNKPINNLYGVLSGITLYNTVTDLINALSGNSSVNTAQHATIEETVFSVI